MGPAELLVLSFSHLRDHLEILRLLRAVGRLGFIQWQIACLHQGDFESTLLRRLPNSCNLYAALKILTRAICACQWLYLWTMTMVAEIASEMERATSSIFGSAGQGRSASPRTSFFAMLYQLLRQSP